MYATFTRNAVYATLFTQPFMPAKQFSSCEMKSSRLVQQEIVYKFARRSVPSGVHGISVLLDASSIGQNMILIGIRDQGRCARTARSSPHLRAPVGLGGGIGWRDEDGEYGEDQDQLAEHGRCVTSTSFSKKSDLVRRSFARTPKKTHTPSENETPNATSFDENFVSPFYFQKISSNHTTEH